jgi:hypothetical protein
MDVERGQQLSAIFTRKFAIDQPVQQRVVVDVERLVHDFK